LTTSPLCQICESLDPGGQTKLARFLGWHPSTIRRNLSGKSKITQADELGNQASYARCARKNLPSRAPPDSAGQDSETFSETERLLNRRKCNRGDWTPLELFIAGVRGWEGHLRWQFENSKSK
jgi:hypothetical protein